MTGKKLAIINARPVSIFETRNKLKKGIIRPVRIRKSAAVFLIVCM